MSQIGRALDGGLSHTISGDNQSNMNNVDGVEPENLSAMDLVYAVYAEDGTRLVGSPCAGFAYLFERTNTLVVISADPSKVRHVQLDRVMATHGMELAQELGASFVPYGNQVVCNIKGISQVGRSYAEAAMRAILASKRHEKSALNDKLDA